MNREAPKFRQTNTFGNNQTVGLLKLSEPGKCTLAIEMIRAGASFEDVAAAHGNTVGVVAKFYSHEWAKVRQGRTDTNDRGNQEASTGVNSAGATMSFFRHGEIYQSDVRGNSSGERPKSRPQLIVPMSLQLAIPRRVALQQSSPPLHQPSVILKEKRKSEKKKPLSCTCAIPNCLNRGVHPTPVSRL
jgi:hypothetical protein